MKNKFISFLFGFTNAFNLFPTIKNPIANKTDQELFDEDYANVLKDIEKAIISFEEQKKN
jgi:hypothetical protein